MRLSVKNTILYTLLFLVLYTSCDSAKKNIEEPHSTNQVTIQEVTIEDSIEEPPPPPPPPNYTSKFATFGEWLNHLCLVENPDSRVRHYKFFLSKKKSPADPDKIQYFMGITGFEKDRNDSLLYEENSAHFYPREIYLSPLKSEYNHLSEAQAIQKVTAELNLFIRSARFKQCFLGKAKSIRFGDKVIL